MKVAVTGATGFIGGKVLAELSRRQVETVATVRPGRPHTNLSSKQVRWVELDITNPPERCLDVLGRPDALLHLAWSGLPNYKSLHHFEQELPHQYRFLADLVRQGLPSLVSAGTCFEYGMQSGPIEASADTRPTNPYGFAKDALRKQLQHLKAQHPFKFAWARLFYMYGDGQASTSLRSTLEAAVKDGKATFSMSGGEQLRDYLPVEEIARQLVDLMLASNDPGPVNICSGSPVSVRRLVESWITEHGWSIELVLGRLPYPDYEPMAFWGDQPSSPP